MRKGWERRTIAELAEHSLGKMLDKAKNRGELRPYLRNLNVRWFGFNLADLQTMRFLVGEEARYTVRKGDLVVCEGGYPGRAAIWEQDEPIYFQKALHRVRFHEPFHARWCLYYLLHQDAFGELRRCFSGTGIQHLTGEALAGFTLPLPPLSEQHRIVALLDEAFAGIAKARENTERNLENAREVFDSFLQGVFSAQQTGWQRTTVDRLSTNLDGRRIPITKADRVAGTYPYYGASGIVDHVADYLFDGDTLLVSEDGANLLARSTPIAFSVSGRYWVNNHAHVLKFKHRATQRFVEFYLESIRIDEFVTGAAQPKLTQKALNSIPIPIPENVDEQARIVDSIESSQAETQHLTALYQRKLAALDALKQSLLHQAFHGDL